MTKQLTTVEEVITELGGYQAIRDLIPRKGISTVLTWNYRKKFPANTYAVLKAALDAKGATAPASLWGMPEADATQVEEAAS